MKIVAFLILISFAFKGFSQNSNEIFWSAQKKLSIDDFGIKVSHSAMLSFCQFSINFKVRGTDAFGGNFNKKVENFIVKSASYIDTTQEIERSLKYQQTLFDIAEIYARQFRKELKANKWKLLANVNIANEIQNRIMTYLSNRRVQYDRETNYGSIADKQLIWAKTIQEELKQLEEFDFEK